MKITLLLVLFVGIFSDNAQTIWNFCKTDLGFTDEGCAGLMGNLEKESGLEPVIYQKCFQKNLGYISADRYAEMAMNGQNNFINDKVGYGLCQWTSPVRKQKLLENCPRKLKDLTCQLEHLKFEFYFWNDFWDRENFRNIANFLKRSDSVYDCSTEVAVKFEKCKKCRDRDPVELNDRAGKSQTYFERFSGKSGSGGSTGGSSGRYHIVKRGDTLAKIARKYGTTVATLKRLNGLKSNTIHTGQRLRLP